MPRQPEKQIDLYLEVGKKRVFAAALDWPGWCRSASDEDAALAALLAYSPRFAQVIRQAGIDFPAPRDLASLRITQRLTGGSTTDFGAPEAVPAGDERPLDDAEIAFHSETLKACWGALDRSVAAAEGKQLRKGPRGGGREIESILNHIQGAEQGYVSMLGKKLKQVDGEDPRDLQPRMRECILQTVREIGAGGVPAPGPRGGKRWPVRYFVRREAWHVLDHAWEIEDRV